MKHVLPWVARAIAVVVLSLCLFSDWLLRSTGFIGSLAREFQAVFRDPQTQWMVMACLVVYFATFLLLERTSSPRARLMKIALVVLVLFALLAYVTNYNDALGSLHPLILLGGITIGQAFAFWNSHERQKSGRLPPAQFLAFALLILLSGSALWHPNFDYITFAYLGRQRWTGPWTNPNTYGVAMGTGFALAAGMLICFWRQPSRDWKDWLALGVSFCAMAPLGLGLSRSYSRGAWASTLAGLIFLLFARYRAGTASSPLVGTRSTAIPSPRIGAGTASSPLEPTAISTLNSQPSTEVGTPPSPSPPTSTPPVHPPTLEVESWTFDVGRSTHGPSLRNMTAAAILLTSLFVLLMLNFRGSEHVLLRRVASIGNPNDFSWRNRVASWEGALQMMSERPLLGHGWGRAETLYDSFHKPAKLETGMAIQMNDYLILGATLGIPALAAFVLLIGLSAAGAPASDQPTRKQPLRDSCPEGTIRSSSESGVMGGSQLLRYAFAAAALVLAISFWFDGGLFKLSTGALFWIIGITSIKRHDL